MRTIRASEIGTYLYCQRAWWYRQQGFEGSNMAEMHTGQKIHARHGQIVAAAGCLHTVAFILLLGALLLIIVYITQQIV